MQLDAWDAETSIPALLMANTLSFTVPVTINNLMPGLASCLIQKEPVGMAGYLSWLFPVVKSLLNLTVRHHTSGMKFRAGTFCLLPGWRL